MKHKLRNALRNGVVVVSLVAVPGVAGAQTETPPPVVQSLADARGPSSYSPWLGAAAGTAVALVGVNAWTGGALLTPAVGAGVSSILGGAWLGAAALPPLSAQSLFETTTLLASGLVGGGVGYWLAGK